MEKFEVNILGCGSAVPTARHMTTAQLVNVHDKLFLVDCGEGTQTQIWKSSIKVTNMNHILPQFGIRKLFKNLVIRDYFCIFVCEFQLLTIYIKNKSHDYRGQNY
jgi:hypothetical protein